MRMWMCDPRILCRRHLLGEHVEMHMFIGHLLRKKKIDGYVGNDLIEPKFIEKRHNEIVKEMENRGMIHKTPIEFYEDMLDYITENHRNHKINKEISLMKLLTRCDECERRFNWIKDIDANLR